MNEVILERREAIIADVRNWMEKAVIGLNLCPFAKSVHVKGQIRFAVSGATSRKALRADLEDELKMLAVSDTAEVDTTLLIHPDALTDFFDYNDFLDIADEVVEELGLTGEIQIASFHPHYQFDGTEPDDIENYTNRSPYPILHLLREASIDIASEAFPDAGEIFDRNIETMRRLGREGWDKLGIGVSETDSPLTDDPEGA
jgi:uncharacterized protein